MPRNTPKKTAVKNKVSYIIDLFQVFQVLHATADPDHQDFYNILLAELEELKILESTRYLHRPSYGGNRTPKNFNYFLQEYNDLEFLHHFRVNRDHFLTFHNTLNSSIVGELLELDLLLLLNFLGCNGNGQSFFRSIHQFNLAYGSIEIRITNATNLILQVKDVHISWPDVNERDIIRTSIMKKFHFPYCVGMVDGTLFPLRCRPHLFPGDYWSRKNCYALTGLIFSDHNKKIRASSLGWPGRCHDNRMWRNHKFLDEPQHYFSNLEYLLADSAFTPSNIIVPSFKRKPGVELPPIQSEFNTLVAKCRYLNENTIGILKGKFPYLRGMSTCIKTNEDIKRVLGRITVFIIFHNVLIDDHINVEWVKDPEYYNPDEPDALDDSIYVESGPYDFKREMVMDNLKLANLL